MKLRFLYTGVLSALILGFTLAGAAGQEKTQEQKEKEAKLQQAIEEQKKAMRMIEQEQAIRMIQQAEELKAIAAEKERLESERAEPGDPSRRTRPSGYIGREGSDAGMFYFGPGSDYSGFGFFRPGGEGERTSIDFSKSMKESTISKQFSFEVESNVKNVVMNIMGDCKTGEIKIKVLMPGGKTYSDVVIDESGNLNWRKSFTIADQENRDKVGEWLFKIEAFRATGYFRISVQAY